MNYSQIFNSSYDLACEISNFKSLVNVTPLEFKEVKVIQYASLNFVSLLIYVRWKM